MGSRWKRNPTGLPRYLTEDGDVQILDALQRHGVLTTWQLWQLCPRFKSIDTIQDRLRVLYDDPIPPYGYLIDRPESARNSINANSKHLWYQRTINSHDVLRERGLFSSHAAAPQPPFPHQAFVSTHSFSLEHGAKEIKGLEFIPQHKANKSGAPLAMPIDLDGKTENYVTDLYAALSYQGRRMYVFNELDRASENTQQIEGRARSNVKKKLQQLQIAVGKGKHKSHFGVQSDAILLFATVRPGRVKNLISIMESLQPQGCPWALFGAFPSCATLDRIPNYIDIYNHVWERAGHPPVRILDLLK